MPPGWEKEFLCASCMHTIPNDGSGCCNTPQPTNILAQWARRFGGHSLSVRKKMNVNESTLWYRVLFFPHVAYGDAKSYEDGANVCESILKGMQK